MSNILTIPTSGSIYFDSNTAGSSTVPDLTGNAVSLNYDGVAGINIASYNTGVSATDRFSVDGSAGRLFSVGDSLTGTIFSVNDAAGLPIIEVNSDEISDVVTIGTYGTNALVVSGSNVGIGTTTPASKLDILDTTLAGSGGLSGSAFNIAQTWNTTGTPTAIKLNVTDTDSNASSLLMDLQVGGNSKFRVQKNGATIINGKITPVNIWLSNDGLGTAQYGVWDSSTLKLKRNYTFGWGNSDAYVGSGFDVALVRDGAGILAQRNGINPQTFRLYNTYDESNYERGFMRWNSNVLEIGTEAAGTGTARNLNLASPYIYLNSNSDYLRNLGGNMWLIGLYGSWLGYGGNAAVGADNNASRPCFRPTTDNSHDLGRDDRWWKTVYGYSFIGSNLTASGDVEITDSTKGIILKSPDNTRWRVTVNDDGTLSTASI